MIQPPNEAPAANPARASDSTQSKPLSGALRELLSDPLSGLAIVAYLAVFKLLLHFYFNAFSYYGYFGEELYFIDLGKHLDWGYVDNAPLTMWMGRLSRELMGDSVFALRFFPAIAGALTIVIAGLMARELGGGRFAQGLAALAVLVATGWLETQNHLCAPASEPVWWGLCAYFLMRIIKTGNTRYWVWFGVSAGMGLLNKPSMLFLCAAIGLSLLLTPQRRYLFDRWAVMGGLAALVIVSPYILWNVAHGWPTLEFLAGIKRQVTNEVPSLEFLHGQTDYLHAFNFAIWLAGLGWFFFGKAARPFRVFGWAYLFLLAFLLVSKGKTYYLAPVYPFLLAGGAVAIERWVNQRGLRRLKWVLPAILVVGGLAKAPMALPLLPIEKAYAYMNIQTNGPSENPLPFADYFGWENQARVVAEVFHRLSPEEQANCIILADQESEAGAIDYYGPALGLPSVTCVQMNYYFWGPPTKTGMAIAFGANPDALRQFWGQIQQAATIRCPQAIRREQNVPVYVCREPLVSLKDAWPEFRDYAFRSGY
jgi:hypothetical protein